MKRSGWLGRLGLVVAGSLASIACGGEPDVRAAFASDFRCDDAVAEDTSVSGRYRVTGCGREATYQCVGPWANRVCAIQVIDGERPSSRSGSSATPPPRSEPERTAAPPAPRKAAASEVLVEQNGDEAVLKVELVLAGALLRITATPDKQVDLVQLKLIREVRNWDSDECNMDWMLNGQVLVTPKSTALHKGGLLAQRVQVGRDLIAEFGNAEKISLRICQQRWALTPEQVQKIREFMARFQEEMAWKATPREAVPASP